jgi:hypothetical protein
MQFLLASMLLAIATATPVMMNTGENRNNLERCQVRCAIWGYEGDDISSTAPFSGIAGTSATGSLTIQREDGFKWDNGNKLPITQTISATDSKLAQDVHWTQDWEVGGYKSCSISYGTGNPTIPGTLGAHDLQAAEISFVNEMIKRYQDKFKAHPKVGSELVDIRGENLEERFYGIEALLIEYGAKY